MEESKKAEDEKFIDRVDDEVDVRIGTNTKRDKDLAKRTENSGTRGFPSIWSRKKVSLFK